MSSYRSNSPTGNDLLWTAVMCCTHLLLGCISSKLEMQGIDLDFLQINAVGYCAKFYGFKYQHTFGLKCCRLKSNILSSFVYMWVTLLDWTIVIHITLVFAKVIVASPQQSHECNGS
jgi:hypothetical protein